jgi:hypothetical protein
LQGQSLQAFVEAGRHFVLLCSMYVRLHEAIKDAFAQQGIGQSWGRVVMINKLKRPIRDLLGSTQLIEASRVSGRDLQHA